MLGYISEKLRTLNGFAGYIEVDSQLALVDNTTLSGDEKAIHLAGLFIGFLDAYKVAEREVKSISIACGTSVYIALAIPTGYLIVQMSREQKLLGVRRALAAITAKSFDSTVPAAVETPASAVQEEKKIGLPPISKPAVEPEAAEESVWPSFKQDLLKVMSPIAPENILQRLVGNAFKKTGLEASAELTKSQIKVLVPAILDEIPNAARRKAAEGDVSKLLGKYGI
jgi:hypothetical protein